MAEFVETTAETVAESDPVEVIPVSKLITVKQLPIIEEQLESMRRSITEMVNEVLALPVTDETVKQIKKKKAALNKQLKELDAKRKEVKNKVTEPYDRFEKRFKDCVTKTFTEADKILSARISEVENARKAEKEANVRAYFAEYAETLSIPDYITFERLGLEINLSTSEKKYREQVKAFLDRAKADLQLIETQESADEILVEYKKTLDASRAILEVNNRHKLIEAERKRAEDLRRKREEEAAAAAKVEAVYKEELATQPPVEAPAPIPVAAPTSEPVGITIEGPISKFQLYEGTFTLIGTKEQIKNIIEYIKEKGVQIHHHGKFTKVTATAEA